MADDPNLAAKRAAMDAWASATAEVGSKGSAYGLARVEHGPESPQALAALQELEDARSAATIARAEYDEINGVKQVRYRNTSS